jgi:fatty-acyl-CoA synthase
MSSVALDVARAHQSGRVFKDLNDLLIGALRTYNDRILLHSWERRSFTGSQLEAEIARYVAALEKQGVELGRTVGLLSGNCVEVLFAQQAIGIIGGIFTPFHPMGSPNDFAYILNDADIDIVIVDKNREADILKAIELSGRSSRVLTLGGGGEGDLSLLASQEEENRINLRPIDPEAITRIVYTGGTTGVPKATLASYRAMSTMYGIQLADWQWPKEVRQLLVAPLSHAGATCFIPTIVNGGTLYVENGFDPMRVLSAIEQFSIPACSWCLP